MAKSVMALVMVLLGGVQTLAAPCWCRSADLAASTPWRAPTTGALAGRHHAAAGAGLHRAGRFLQTWWRARRRGCMGRRCCGDRPFAPLAACRPLDGVGFFAG